MLSEPIPKFEILRTGYYRHTNPKSSDRIVKTYIIELFRIKSGSMNIEGESFLLEPDVVTFTRPDTRRSSVAPFECWFVHFNVMDDGSFMRGFDAIPNMFRLTDGSDELIGIFSALRSEFMRGDGFAAGLRLAELLCMLRRKADIGRRMKRAASPGEKEAVTCACEFIDTNYGEAIQLADIASAVHLSPNYLHTMFQRVTGETPLAMLTRVRMEKALDLLALDTDIAEIAQLCGFESQSYFSYVFRKRFGISPREFRSRGIY